MTPYSLTVSQTRARYGIGRTKIYKLISAGKIKAIKLDARTLIVADSVESYLATLPPLRAT